MGSNFIRRNVDRGVKMLTNKLTNFWVVTTSDTADLEMLIYDTEGRSLVNDTNSTFVLNLAFRECVNLVQALKEAYSSLSTKEIGSVIFTTVGGDPGFIFSDDGVSYFENVGSPDVLQNCFPLLTNKLYGINHPLITEIYESKDGYSYLTHNGYTAVASASVSADVAIVTPSLLPRKKLVINNTHPSDRCRIGYANLTAATNVCHYVDPKSSIELNLDSVNPTTLYARSDSANAIVLVVTEYV